MARRKTIFVKHTFGGGWATDFGPSAIVPIEQNGHATVPFLTTAENCIYELDGGPHKMPGSTKNFAAALESGADITGIYDAWFSGVAGTPTQRRIMHVGTKIKRDAADNTFVDLFTGMTSGAVPCYSMFEDILIMSNTSDVPKSWDLTTAQNLAGTPPSFAFSVAHKNKVFASGAVAQPSRLYYCVDFNPEDWAGAGSGFIDIDPDDGDIITGIASYNDDLWVFKGPNKGSIHRITGSAPTGGDAYARRTFSRGIPCGSHNSIVPFANDLAFMCSDGTVRTLSAVDQYGDFTEAAASRPINKWLREHVTKSSIRKVQGCDWDDYGLVIYAIPIDGGTVNTCLIAMDYRFQPARWMKWPAMSQTISICMALDLTTKAHQILLGGTDGFLRTLGSSIRTIDDSTAIPFNVATPFMDYDVPERTKTIGGGSVTVVPVTDGSLTYGWSRDGQTNQTKALEISGAGAVLGSFILGTDSLAIERYLEVFFRPDKGDDAGDDEGGEFRSIRYTFTNGSAGMDIEMHTFSSWITPGAESFENI
jgi:hypothetical protein